MVVQSASTKVIDLEFVIYGDQLRRRLETLELVVQSLSCLGGRRMAIQSNSAAKFSPKPYDTINFATLSVSSLQSPAV